MPQVPALQLFQLDLHSGCGHYGARNPWLGLFSRAGLRGLLPGTGSDREQPLRSALASSSYETVAARPSATWRAWSPSSVRRRVSMRTWEPRRLGSRMAFHSNPAGLWPVASKIWVDDRGPSGDVLVGGLWDGCAPPANWRRGGSFCLAYHAFQSLLVKA